MSNRTINGIAIVVTAVWAVSFIADIALSSYEPSPYLHVIMMMVAGAAFGTNIVRRPPPEDDPPIERKKRA